MPKTMWSAIALNNPARVRRSSHQLDGLIVKIVSLDRDRQVATVKKLKGDKRYYVPIPNLLSIQIVKG